MCDIQQTVRFRCKKSKASVSRVFTTSLWVADPSKWTWRTSTALANSKEAGSFAGGGSHKLRWQKKLDKAKFKVIFWESHKSWKNLPLKIWSYWVASNFKLFHQKNKVQIFWEKATKFEKNLTRKIWHYKDLRFASH